ncbi:MAG: 6-phosphogluconolactonase [Nocardioidaceae bacterium]
MSADRPGEIEVSPTPADLARSVAERLVRTLVRIQGQGGVPSVVLTGGTIAEAVHRAVLEVPDRAEVDWSRVEIWFGDERFVPAGDPQRNALQSRDALLAAVPVDATRVHEMPASDGPFGDDVDAAASAYAGELRRVLGPAPRFDVLMLGVGPDGHCASLFPHHEGVQAPGLVVAVRDSPKPPPTRISLTMGLLGQADEVWFFASGGGKAQAVHDALTSDDVDAVPASGPKGRQRTLWLLDAEAASKL